MTQKEMLRRIKDVLCGDEKDKKLFSSFGRVYPMTTENIAGYYKGLIENGCFEDKDILTVCSSGDHIFCALPGNPKQIDCFDINALTEYYYYLKKAVIESSNLETFKNYFIRDFVGNGILPENWYEQFRDNINSEYQEFWDYVVEFVLSNNLSFNPLFIHQGFGLKQYNFLTNYLTEDGFKLLQDKVNDVKPNFIHSDLNKLGNYLQMKYDYMFLSNIASYFGINETKDVVSKKLSPYLKGNGEVYYAYMTEACLSTVKKYNPSRFVDFPSTVEGGTDYVLSYKK